MNLQDSKYTEGTSFILKQCMKKINLDFILYCTLLVSTAATSHLSANYYYQERVQIWTIPAGGFSSLYRCKKSPWWEFSVVERYNVAWIPSRIVSVSPPPPIEVSTHPGLTTLSEIPSSLRSAGVFATTYSKLAWTPCRWDIMNKVHLDRPRHSWTLIALWIH